MKSCHINQWKIDTHIDNREMWRRIEITTKVENHFNQDSAVEIKVIKRMMKEVNLDMKLKRKPGHKEVWQTLYQNTGQMLIKICDEEGKKVRMKKSDKEASNNMMHCGNQVTTKEVQIDFFQIKELLRGLNTGEEQCNFTKKNSCERAELVYKKERLNIKKLQTIESAMKCYYGHNCYNVS